MSAGGGILSPFLWNLVVDSLLSFTKDKIPCDLQGFADDLALLATTEAPKVKGVQGFDADTLREMTQKSLELISSWGVGSPIPILKHDFSEIGIGKIGKIGKIDFEG